MQRLKQTIIASLAYHISLFLSALLFLSILLALVPDSTRFSMGFFQRFAEIAGIIITLDFGNSIHSGFPVLDIALASALKSFYLICSTLIGVMIIGLTLGIALATRPYNRVYSYTGHILCRLSSIPTLIWASLLMLFMFRNFGMVPVYGDIGSDNLTVSTMAMILPVIALSLGDNILGNVIVTVREQSRSLLNQTYMRSLRVRNISTTRHLLRNLVPVLLNALSSKIAYLISGLIVVEYIFNWQGLGWQIWQAMIIPGAKDYSLIIACVSVIVLWIILINLFRDLMNRMVNPHLY